MCLILSPLRLLLSGMPSLSANVDVEVCSPCSLQISSLFSKVPWIFSLCPNPACMHVCMYVRMYESDYDMCVSAQ